MIADVFKIIGFIFILLLTFVLIKSGTLDGFMKDYSSDKNLDRKRCDDRVCENKKEKIRGKIDTQPRDCNNGDCNDGVCNNGVCENKKEKHSCLMEEHPQLISMNKITEWPNGNIYISDLYTAKCPNVIKKYNIKGVISICQNQYDPIAPHHIIINILDEPNTILSKHYDKVHGFIDERLAAGENVLVHCHAGISRSVSMVISYLMKKNKTKYHQTWLQVRAKRPQAEPNFGFVEQLQKYEQELKL